MHQQQQQQTGTPLIGTYHRRGECKKQEIVAQAHPWRRQKKRIDLHKKNILPFSVSARRFGFGPSRFPARLVIVVGSSRALGGRRVRGISKEPPVPVLPTLHSQRTASLLHGMCRLRRAGIFNKKSQNKNKNVTLLLTPLSKFHKK
jgi:hypothetical protein